VSTSLQTTDDAAPEPALGYREEATAAGWKIELKPDPGAYTSDIGAALALIIIFGPLLFVFLAGRGYLHWLSNGSLCAFLGFVASRGLRWSMARRARRFLRSAIHFDRETVRLASPGHEDRSWSRGDLQGFVADGMRLLVTLRDGHEEPVTHR
jgi:hypothetical protein